MESSAMLSKKDKQTSVTQNRLGYSISQAAEQSSLSKAYLRQKIKEGQLKANYFRRRVVILHEHLEEFLQKGIK